MRASSLSLLRLAPLALACSAVPAYAAHPKLDPALVRASAGAAPVEAMIEVRGSADALLLDPAIDPVERRRAWVAMLQSTAKRAQSDLLDYLAAAGIEHQAFWINNTVWIRADVATLERVAQRADVTYIHNNPQLRQKLPQPEPNLPGPMEITAVEWGVTKIRAPLVWAAGVTGQGVVISGQDTGYRWDHNAIKAKYRGYSLALTDHNYNWHDSVHVGGGSCGPNTVAPCDDHGHGTHTMGTMVGDDGGTNQVGVAPGAKWIGCRNMNAGVGSPATYTECMQWLLAPTDLAGANPDPSKAPDIISNSWGCPADEGCTPTTILESAVDNLVNGGIFFAAAAANDGPSCGTITAPPALYDSSFVIGSTTSGDAMSGFSSRGPVPGATNKPDVSAPGSSIRSATRSSVSAYATLSGTSMATPHVAGAAALLIAANPALRGHPDAIAGLLRLTAVPVADSQVCGGIPATTFPNPVQGMGRIDVYAAYLLATDKIFTDDFD